MGQTIHVMCIFDGYISYKHVPFFLYQVGLLYVHECPPQHGHNTKSNGFISLAAPGMHSHMLAYCLRLLHITKIFFKKTYFLIHDLTSSRLIPSNNCLPPITLASHQPSNPRLLFFLFF